jgi:hypothetical protein
MENNSVPKFIFRLSRFPVYMGSGLDRFYCNNETGSNDSLCTGYKGKITVRVASGEKYMNIRIWYSVDVLLTVRSGTSVRRDQRDALFIQFIKN